MTNQEPSMNPALRDFWAKPSPGKVLYGGRMSTKSWDAAANANRISQYTQVRILCTRMFQNKIEESVYNTLKSQAIRFGIDHLFEYQRGKIKCKTTGSEFIFYGLSRNTDEIKSLEGIDILWIEEAHALTEEMWEILEPTIIRNEGAEVWIVFNPRLATDFAYRRFVLNPPNGYIVRKINYDENPFLPQGALDKIKEKRAESEEDYMHIYEGVPRDNDDRAIIKRTWVQSAIDAHKKLDIEPTGEARIGFDVADDGEDLNAMVWAKGVLCEGVTHWKGQEDELLKSATLVYSKAQSLGASIDYDSIGVGASMGAKFKELNETKKGKIEYRQFNAGGKVLEPEKEYMPKVKNKDHFANIKAQAWQTVADRLMKTHAWVTKGQECDPSEIISISSDCQNLEALITELSTPFRDFDPSGKTKVESKKDLAKRDVKSPNMADAFIMAFANVKRSKVNWGALA